VRSAEEQPSGHRAPAAPCRAAWPAAPPRACRPRARAPVRARQGYVDYDPALHLEGVILNRVGGEAHARWLTEAVAGSGVATRVLGGIPEARPASLRCVPRRDVRPAALRASSKRRGGRRCKAARPWKAARPMARAPARRAGPVAVRGERPGAAGGRAGRGTDLLRRRSTCHSAARALSVRSRPAEAAGAERARAGRTA